MRVQLRHNSKRGKLLRIVAVMLFVVGIGMVLPRAFSAVSMFVMYPVHATNMWLEESASLVPTFFRDRQTLQTRVEYLENELVVASRVDITQQRLLEENNSLRQLLGDFDEERVLAAVIARPGELPYDFLQIDRGYRHGIEVGSPVFAGSDIVIGLVVHVASSYSFVELFTTSGFEATAFIGGPNVIAIMEGFGGGVARVRVPQGISMRVGNLVYLPSIEPGVFGRISHVENLPTQPEQYGYITPDISISSLHRVAVGQQSQISRSASEIDEQVKGYLQTSLLIEGVVITESGTTTETSASSTDNQESL